jgi:signal transduction histidine kinase
VEISGEGLLDERQLRRLHDVAKNLVAELDLEQVLHQVLEVARDLTEARYAALGILSEDKRELERFLYVGIDEETRRAIGPLPRGRGVLGELIRDPAPLRLDDVSQHPRSYGFPADHPPMKTFLGVPIVVRGEAYGNLYLTEKEGGVPFDEFDEELVVLLSQWASVAITNARSVESEKLRLSIEAAEQERRRWARELHDETLQELGALKVLLEASMQRGSDSASSELLERTVDRVAQAIGSLEDIIADLRPATLDELGLVPAIEELVHRTTDGSGIRIISSFEFPSRAGAAAMRLEPQLESAIYRLVQEALRNVVKHAGAREVELSLRQQGGDVEVTVRDDGRGFDPLDASGGFGLVGISERVALSGGNLRIDSGSGVGTSLTATLPLREAEREGRES